MTPRKKVRTPRKKVGTPRKKRGTPRKKASKAETSKKNNADNSNEEPTYSSDE